MVIVNVLTITAVSVVIIYLIFQLKFWGRIFGIEYIEERYTFNKPLDGDSVRDLFFKLERTIQESQICKNVNFRIITRTFYSISDDDIHWTSWIPYENMPDKSFDGYQIRYNHAWVMLADCGYDLKFVVRNDCIDGDNLFFKDCMCSSIRLVTLGVIKFPWNKRKIKKLKQFLKDVVACLKAVDK